MSPEPITPATPLSEVIAWVRRQYGVTIDARTAQQIKNAARAGKLQHDATGLRTTDAKPITITARR